MEALRFYVLFNSISVIPDDVRAIMKGCVQWNLDYGWKFFRLKWGSNTGPLISRPPVNH